MALENMGDQFRGLPMNDLIGAPLIAACDAQLKLANATAQFIQTVGFLPPADPSKGGVGDVRTALFRYARPSLTLPANEAGVVPQEQVDIEVPLLAIVRVPTLAVDEVEITFDMEVKNSESSKDSDDKSGSFSGTGQVGWGPFSLSVTVSGSVSSHKENTRSSDQSAKYHVMVRATDKGMPEGLARVIDIMAQSVAPKAITAAGKAPSPQ